MLDFQVELLTYLACPQTKQKLTVLAEEDLLALNHRIKTSSVKNESGFLLAKELSGALLTLDLKRIYPIRSGVAVMLFDESIKN